ncbi:MAG TPA: aldehyde dehydrogenase (NADP(+)) [Micromonospora sp.]|nr:aldehyde dehydrogenase (NADP(+)) [Micromonospora sp.]
MIQVDPVVRDADEAFEALERHGRVGRAALLDGIAEALEAERERLIPIAHQETALGVDRLNGELTRSCYQFRLFAEVLREGSYLEATIDPPGETPLGPRPDLRRMLLPVGVVGVFGASNFPFAFSVAGGDTASALAAGCPVVVKAHPSHPETSLRSFAAMRPALREAGLPEGVLGLVEGHQAGVDLVVHPAVAAVGFTGSLGGGRELHKLAAARPRPIPFYGEFGSLNPLVVSPVSAAENSAEIAAGYVASATLGLGQFCTKPGLLFVPAGSQGDGLRADLAAAIARTEPGRLLNTGIYEAFVQETERRREDARLCLIGESAADVPGKARPVMFGVDASDLTDDLLEECFGPTSLVVGYRDVDELVDALNRLTGQLTATLHVSPTEVPLLDRLHKVVRGRAGRLVFGGYPTGVAVSWATHHGGPYPSTSHSGYTSVGAGAIKRWLRPISYQNAPQEILPAELRDASPAGLPRRVNGSLVT